MYRGIGCVANNMQRSSQRNVCCSVLLIDELDYIMTKKQSVIYNLFDWYGAVSCALDRVLPVFSPSTMAHPRRTWTLTQARQTALAPGGDWYRQHHGLARAADAARVQSSGPDPHHVRTLHAGRVADHRGCQVSPAACGCVGALCTHRRGVCLRRLEGLSAFDPDAVEFCARKVASVSGDVRRALHICRCVWRWFSCPHR